MQPLYVPAVALHNIVTSIPQAIGTRLARRVVTETAIPKRIQNEPALSEFHIGPFGSCFT